MTPGSTASGRVRASRGVPRPSPASSALRTAFNGASSGVNAAAPNGCGGPPRVFESPVVSAWVAVVNANQATSDHATGRQCRDSGFPSETAAAPGDPRRRPAPGWMSQRVGMARQTAGGCQDRALSRTSIEQHVTGPTSSVPAARCMAWRPTPPMRNSRQNGLHSDLEWRLLVPSWAGGSRVSARNRGHCRPGTGAASRNCQPATGATMSSMNRVRTH